MLQIKFNINEFTIVFFFTEKIGRKKNAQKISFSLPVQRLPSFLFSLCSVQRLPFLLFFLFQRFFFFLVSFSAPPFVSVQRLLLFLFFLPFFSFQFTCCPFFQPKNIFFQPKTILSSTQTCCSFKFSPSFLFFFSGQRLLLFFFLFFPTFLKASPKLVAAQKAHSISPIRVCLSIKMKSNCLPQNQEGPAFHANSQAKKKTSSFNLHSSKTQYSL